MSFIWIPSNFGAWRCLLRPKSTTCGHRIPYHKCHGTSRNRDEPISAYIFLEIELMAGFMPDASVA